MKVTMKEDKDSIKFYTESGVFAFAGIGLKPKIEEFLKDKKLTLDTFKDLIWKEAKLKLQ